MEEIHPHRGSGPSDANGNRPQEKYYQERREADDWLRRSVNELGSISIERRNPVFFALTNDREVVLKAMLTAPCTDVLVVEVNKTDLSKFSFTFGDSMGNHLLLQGKDAFLSGRHEMNGQIMDFKTLAEAIKKFGLGADGVEAHYWSPIQPDGVIIQGGSITPSHDAKSSATATTAKPLANTYKRL